jgi:uncharacterized protein YegP (UPF0339 family)
MTCVLPGVLGALLALPAADVPPAGLLVAQAGDGKMKFEIYQDKDKEFRWRLKAADGSVLATAGQGYKAKADAQKGVERLKQEAAGDKLKFEVYEDKGKEFRWRLKAASGQVVAASGAAYKAKGDAEKAIEAIKKGAAKAEVEDKT